MAAAKSAPKDAQVMAAILKDMGILDYEPRVINHMLEFTYRYVTDVLDDAKVYSTHAGKKEIHKDDVKLAVQCKLDHSFTTPPPKHLLVEISKQKNENALPVIKPYTGPKLPPDRYCLSATNYKLRSVKKQTAPVVGGVQQTPTRMMTPGNSMISVRSTPLSGIATPQHFSTPQQISTPQQLSAPQMYSRLNAMHNMQQTGFMSGGVKRKLEDDDYDAVS